jgi:hypothetical protein
MRAPEAPGPSLVLVRVRGVPLDWAVRVESVRQVVPLDEWSGDAPIDPRSRSGIHPLSDEPRQVMVADGAYGEIAIDVRGAVEIIEVDATSVMPLPRFLFDAAEHEGAPAIVYAPGSAALILVDLDRWDDSGATDPVGPHESPGDSERWMKRCDAES